jgi:hypothetical protein
LFGHPELYCQNWSPTGLLNLVVCEREFRGEAFKYKRASLPSLQNWEFLTCLYNTARSFIWELLKNFVSQIVFTTVKICTLSANKPSCFIQ